MSYQKRLQAAYAELYELITEKGDLDLQDGPYIPEIAAKYAADGSERYHLICDLFNQFF